MQYHLSVVNLLSIVISVALFQKLAARMMRRTLLSWRHSVIFALCVAMLNCVDLLASHLIINDLIFGTSLILKLFGPILIGGWFFRFRATTSTGEALGWFRGMQLAAYGFVLMVFAMLVYTMLKFVMPN